MFTIIVKFQFEGFHRWEKCPHGDVSFLRTRHRHVFHVTAEVLMTHSDRDEEFIRLKRRLQDIWDDGSELGNKSCERIAEQIGAKIESWNLTCHMVEVLEDGENGGRWYR
ncbi:MAG: hypothetical protein GY835_22695 [bacterium]|nr:hypothetical protein [bacterium]